MFFNFVETKKKETGRFFSHWSGFTYIKVRENDSGFNSRPIETKKILTILLLAKENVLCFSKGPIRRIRELKTEKKYFDAERVRF